MARELITIHKEELKPRIVCGHCKQEILISIAPFEKDCTKIIKDNCPKCKNEIFVGIMIIAHPKLNGLLTTLGSILEVLNFGDRKILGGKRQAD